MSEQRLVGSRYEIIKMVGQGGMGAVYRARDTVENRDVALKEMASASSDSIDDKARHIFTKEGEILRQLSHPGIPRIWAQFVEGNSYFLVMEFIDGTSLDTLVHEYRELTGTPLPLNTIVDYAVQICEILRYLHESLKYPVVHRDIKPSNLILVENNTRVVLVDFGLARLKANRPHTEVGDSSLSLTATSGTLRYAPVEQLQGKAETRSDVYSLGATIHFMLTGKAPVPLKPCVPRLERSEVNVLLSSVVEKATQPKPEDRFASAADMEAILRQVQIIGRRISASPKFRTKVRGGSQSSLRGRPRRGSVASSSTSSRSRDSKSADSRLKRPRTAGAAPRPRAQPPAADQNAAPDKHFLEGTGVALLKEQKYPEAMAYFQKVARERPASPEGWLGVGAVLLVQGDLAGGLEWMAKGSRGVDHSLCGELVAAGEVGTAVSWFRLANHCAKQRTQESLICALSFFEACLRAPNLPSKYRFRAAEGYNACMTKLRNIGSRYGYRPGAVSVDERSFAVGQSISTFIWKAVLLILLTVGMGWCLYKGFYH